MTRGRDGSILVVDDDAEMRDLLKDVLTDAGYHVGVAGNGQEALKQLAERGVCGPVLGPPYEGDAGAGAAE